MSAKDPSPARAEDLVPPLERIRAQHFELRRRTRRLREALDGAPMTRSQRVELDSELRAFEVALNEHFALEEADGYFSDVLRVAPRLSTRASALEKAHRGFRRDLTVLRECAIDPEIAWDELRRRFQLFLAELRAHEAAEDDLVHEAFQRDLGEG